MTKITDKPVTDKVLIDGPCNYIVKHPLYLDKNDYSKNHYGQQRADDVPS